MSDKTMSVGHECGLRPIAHSVRWRRLLAVCSALLVAGGCTDPHTGRVDYLNTALMGGAVGAALFSVGGAIEDSTRGRKAYDDYGYGPPGRHRGGYERGWGYGSGGGYGW